MNINELQIILHNLIGKVTNRKLAEIWGFDEATVSRKKSSKDILNAELIKQVEKYYDISLIPSDKYTLKQLPEPRKLNLDAFINNVQTLRAENGLTLDKFCKITGISEKEYLSWVDGKEPKISDLLKIVNNFDTTFDTLLIEQL